MDEGLFKRILESYLSGCELVLEYDSGDAFFKTGKMEVSLKSPDGVTLWEGVAYMSAFEKENGQG